MWITLGVYAIALQTGIFKVVDTKEFNNPEDCFREALVVMQDENDPRGMLCLPFLKEGT
jgi:hypothetical protein